MKIEYDEDVDAMYIKLHEGKFGRNKKVDDSTILDYDKEGSLMGIELLEISKRIPKEALTKISLKNLKAIS